MDSGNGAAQDALAQRDAAPPIVREALLRRIARRPLLRLSLQLLVILAVTTVCYVLGR